MNKDVKIFFELLKDDEYCLLYNGNFIDTITSKIINITKVSLIQRGELIKTQNRYAYLIAECFQNIIRHGGHKQINFEETQLPGFFMAKIKNGFYDLVTGNLINNSFINELKDKFDLVNSLDDAGLKYMYKKALSEGELSEKGGAGLGLIDMAKKSAQKLEYEFLEQDKNSSMFYQRLVMVSTANIETRSGNDHNIQFGVKLHNAMINSEILVLQKSDFSKNTVVPMLSIVEKNILSKAIDTVLVKIVYQILIELIQTINNKDLELKSKKEGLFLISKKDNSYSICSGYYVANNKIDWLTNFIDGITTSIDSKFENEIINSAKIIESAGVDQSELENTNITKIIADRFKFEITKIDDKNSYFTINAVFD